jgi:hypothetical protein
MFGRSQAVTFEYGSRRTRKGVPRWLLVLLTGVAAGGGGLWYLQERVLPPRLTADASAQLRAAYEQADAERTRLAVELKQATQQRDAALAAQQNLTAELSASRASTERLQGDLASVVGQLPPDPRNGAVEVRAARFSAAGGMLAYDVVLTRDRATAKPMPGLMQLVVTGASAQRAQTTVTLKPITLSLGTHEVLRGSLPLPAGFQPQQTTVQILDRTAGKVLGMRMLIVK